MFIASLHSLLNSQDIIYRNMEKVCHNHLNGETHIKFLEDKSSLQAFFQEESFGKQLRQQLLKHHFGFSIATEPCISMPSIGAIKWHADRYCQKYEISLFVTPCNELTNFLENRLSTVTHSMYIGVIVYPDVEIDLNVTPLLIYLPSNKEKHHVECIIMDGQSRDIFSQKLLLWGMKEDNLFKTTQSRLQSSRFYRTAALCLLRNALLAARYYSYANGFKKILSEESEMQENNILLLPPVWDYTEETTNALLNEKHLAIRSCFSKNSAKHSLTAKQHREFYVQKQSIHCRIWQNCKPILISDPPPPHVSYDRNLYCWEISFTSVKMLNLYLVKKGHKNAQLTQKT